MVWTQTDPYVNVSGGDVILLFRSTRDTYEGDMAHLISTRTDVGARAARSGLCNKDFAYAATGLFPTVIPLPTYSWNVHAFTHEIGHNFGSRHTHACAWNNNNTAIDGCRPTEGSCSNPGVPEEGGTIMSYCHVNPVGVNFNLGFGPQPGDLMRSNYQSATCLNPCNEAGCPDERLISVIYNDDDDIHLEASERIIARNIINSGARIDYDAGLAVELKPRFNADYGSVFNAFIDGCSGIPKLSGGGNNNTEAEETTNAATLLLRNYPNPFTGTTTIEFHLNEDSPVTLSVSNITGRRIAVLLNNGRYPAGTHQVTFDGNAYPAGMYYYTIQAGAYTGTQKMTLVK